MDRIYVMQLVRSFQVGEISRRTFLKRATAAVGTLAAANMLLAACEAYPTLAPPPVVDEEATTANTESGEVAATAGLTAGMVEHLGGGEESFMGHLVHDGANNHTVRTRDRDSSNCKIIQAKLH